MAKRKLPDLKMAKREISWRNRRWKIFENEFNSNPAFRNELADAISDKEPYAVYESILKILSSYRVPRACITAVIKKLYNPDLKRQEYLSEIHQPITYWNATMEYIGPNIDVTPAEHLEHLFQRAGLKVTKNNKPVSGDVLLDVIAGDSTFLQLDPYVNISEIRELIDYHWKVDLEKMVNINSPSNDQVYGAKLLGKVQPDSKTKRRELRDAKIMELHNKGKSDNEIFNYLLLNKEKYEPIPALESIKVIRFRNNQKSR